MQRRSGFAGFALAAIAATRPSERETPYRMRVPMSGEGMPTPCIKASGVGTFPYCRRAWYLSQRGATLRRATFHWHTPEGASGVFAAGPA